MQLHAPGGGQWQAWAVPECSMPAPPPRPFVDQSSSAPDFPASSPQPGRGRERGHRGHDSSCAAHRTEHMGTPSTTPTTPHIWRTPAAKTHTHTERPRADAIVGAHHYEGGAGGIGWNRGNQRCEEERHEKAKGDHECRDAGAPALADACGGLDVDGQGRAAQERSDHDGDTVHAEGVELVKEGVAALGLVDGSSTM